MQHQFPSVVPGQMVSWTCLVWSTAPGPAGDSDFTSVVFVSHLENFCISARSVDKQRLKFKKEKCETNSECWFCIRTYLCQDQWASAERSHGRFPSAGCSCSLNTGKRPTRWWTSAKASSCSHNYCCRQVGLNKKLTYQIFAPLDCTYSPPWHLSHTPPSCCHFCWTCHGEKLHLRKK